jgi:small conductance mechanosensitive channel
MDARAAEAASEQAEIVTEGASRAVLETGHLLGLLIDKLRGWVEAAVQMLPNLIAALVILLLFAVASRLVSTLVLRAGRRSRLESELVGLLASTARVATLAVGVFVALGVLQLEKTVTSLLAGVGVIGLALGFAFQDIAANFMAGIIMALRRPFREGQLVETHGVMGFVKRVTLRATVVRNFEGQDVIIPNKDVLQNPIVNYEQSGERRVDVDVGVSYDDDLEKAKAVAVEAVEAVPERDGEREVSLVYNGFGSSSIDFTVRFWLADPSTFLVARSNAVMAIKKAFDENGITIPFPIRTLDVPSDDREPADADEEAA